MGFYVYELYDNRTNWILYVGQTTQGLGTRFAGHKKNPNKTLKLWAQEAGWNSIGIRLFKSCNDRNEMCLTERWQIKETTPPFNTWLNH